MRARRSAWIASAVLIVMLGFIAVLATNDPSDSQRSTSPLLGRQAPSVVTETVDGDTFELADLRGRYVVVNFFATWCIPCIREHPELVEFQRRHSGEEDASVVSVVYDDRPDTVRAFFEEKGGDWPVVADPDGRIAVSYGVSGVPESYLLAPDGTVISKIVGGVSADELDRLIAEVQGVAG